MKGEVLKIWEEKRQVRISYDLEGQTYESWFEIVEPANIKYARLGACEFSVIPGTSHEPVPSCNYIKSMSSKPADKPFYKPQGSI